MHFNTDVGNIPMLVTVCYWQSSDLDHTFDANKTIRHQHLKLVTHLILHHATGDIDIGDNLGDGIGANHLAVMVTDIFSLFKLSKTLSRQHQDATNIPMSPISRCHQHPDVTNIPMSPISRCHQYPDVTNIPVSPISRWHQLRDVTNITSPT